MAIGRNRASGWRHAKISGHENEMDVERLFNNDDFCNSFSARLGVGKIIKSEVGGRYETNVPSIIGHTTKSKTDLKLYLESGKIINISIKKSWGGQVYLISVDRFIKGYEKHFSAVIPEDIKDSMYLYFYGHEKTLSLLDDINIVAGESPRIISYQKRKCRLVWKSLENYNKAKAEKFLQWIKDNIDTIAEYCFSRGLASQSSEWADYIWYINLLGEDDVDVIFKVSDIKSAMMDNVEKVFASQINGGSTIRLPFGFVQWHQCQMQFHHDLALLLECVGEKY